MLQKLIDFADENMHLFDEQFKISRKEARVIAKTIDKDAIFSNFASSLNAKDEIIVQEIIAERKRKDNNLKTLRKFFVAAAIVFFLLVTSFFAFTPTGRVWAQSIADFFVGFFNSGVVVDDVLKTHEDYGIDIMPKSELPSVMLPDGTRLNERTIEYVTHAAFINDTDKQLLYIDDSNRAITVKRIVYIADDFDQTLKSTYDYLGSEIIISQKWSPSNVFYGGETVKALPLFEQYNILCYEDQKDSTITGFIELKDSIVIISRVKNLDDLKALIDFVVYE